MNVASPLEIPLTILGWLAYDNLWTVLSDTGLVWLPFVFLLARTWIHAREKMDEDEAAMATLRVMENRTIVMLSVVVLAAQPWITLGIGGMSYSKKECDTGVTTSTTVSGGSTGTTYDTVFNATTMGGATAQVPVWWYGVLSVASGLTNAAIAGLPCSPDVRGINYAVSLGDLETDAALHEETSLFYNHCFRAAMNRLDMAEKGGFVLPTTTGDPRIDRQDTEWAGSPFFVNTAGFYDHLYAPSPIPGFAVDATRLPDSHAIAKLGAGSVGWGYPSCKQWWAGDGTATGLRDRLVTHFRAPDPAKFDAYVNKLGSAGYASVYGGISGLPPADYVLRKRMTDHSTSLSLIARNTGTAGYNADASRTAEALSTAGSYLEKITFYPMVFMIREATRNVQAVLLMAVYALLPIVLVFSEYSFTKLFLITVGVFAIKFLGFVWALAYWLDNNMLASLESAGLTGHSTGANAATEHVMDFVAGASYIGLPAVWLMLLGWAGLQVGRDIAGLSEDMSGTASSAGQAGGKAAAGAAKAGVGAGIDKLKGGGKDENLKIAVKSAVKEAMRELTKKR